LLAGGCDYLEWLFCSATDICGYTISTEIQGRNSIKENWDQLFVIFEPPSPNVHPCPVPGFFVCNRTPNTSRFHSRLFPARVKEKWEKNVLKCKCISMKKYMSKCISITYQYICVMWFTELLNFSGSYFSQFIYHGCLLLSLLHWHWAPRV
jgi:hypothetical protein